VEELLKTQLIKREPGQFQVRFQFGDQSHSMDALVLHACEAELLTILKEVGKQLDVEFRIEAVAYQEGSLTWLLTFVGKHATALSLIGTAVTAICSATVWMTYQSTLLRQQIEQNDFALGRDRTLAEQQIEQNALAIKKARLELKRLEEEQSPAAAKAPSTAATKPLNFSSGPTAAEVVPALLSNQRIVKSRSEFYSNLLAYDKVSAVGFAPNHKPSLVDEVVVPRAGFRSYLVMPTELEPTVIRDAEIEIVSAVFKRGSFKWRGLLEKQAIAFDLCDDEFLSKVDRKEVKFQSGTTLICDLEIQLRETISGTPEPHAYTVRNVTRHFNRKTDRVQSRSQAVPTASAANSRASQTAAPSQGSLNLLIRDDH